MRWAILGALSQARERIRIITPTSCGHGTFGNSQVAALRGVAIDIAFPRRITEAGAMGFMGEDRPVPRAWLPGSG